MSKEQVGPVVDVAGGRVALLVALLEKNPDIKGILVDLLGAVNHAREILSQKGL